MPRPIVSDLAEELYIRLGPWHDAAELEGAANDNWWLLQVCESIMGRLQPIEDIVRDTDDGPGWSPVMDVNRAPSDWLGWLAQFAGKTLKQGLTDLAQRARIASTDGIDRGKPGAIVGAAQQLLTGAKTVYLVERNGSAWRLGVTTNAGETPNPDKVRTAILEQKPGGIVLATATVTGANYNALRDTHADYNEIKTTFATYAEVLSNPTKQ
jgi:hypothetical protein